MWHQIYQHFIIYESLEQFFQKQKALSDILVEQKQKKIPDCRMTLMI